MNKWAVALSTDALIFGCFYLWQIQGMTSAGTFLKFVLWTFAALLLLAALFGERKSFKQKKPPGFYGIYATITTVATIGMSIYAGMAGQATVYFVGWVLCRARVSSASEAA